MKERERERGREMGMDRCRRNKGSLRGEERVPAATATPAGCKGVRMHS